MAYPDGRGNGDRPSVLYAEGWSILPRVNYFRARHAVVLFREFRHKALLYWALFPGPNHATVLDEIAGVAGELDAVAPDDVSAERRTIRRRLNELTPTLTSYARELEVWIMYSVRMPMIAGGEQMAIHALESLTHEDPMDAGNLPPGTTLNAIDRCIGAAEQAKRAGLIRLLVPIYWLVDIPALAVRWPWLILERAGLPPDIERHAWSNVVKVVQFAAYLAIVVFLTGRNVGPDLIGRLVPK